MERDHPAGRRREDDAHGPHNSWYFLVAILVDIGGHSRYTIPAYLAQFLVVIRIQQHGIGVVTRPANKVDPLSFPTLDLGRSTPGPGTRHRSRFLLLWPGVVYLEDCWKPCLKQIHPGWLLAFRLVSFFVMASILTYDVVVDGWSVFLYYTQWTFLLVTLYFGLGSVLSIYGCYQYAYKMSGDGSDADHGSYVIAPTGESRYDNGTKTSCFSRTHDGREIAGFWGYLFQIMFQTNAGAVMITDLVFWFILYPFLARNQYHMNFLLIGTHTINVVFIIGDTVLNSLRFPWFRIAYFMLWTGMFVSVQWIIHANVSIWWPYPFLDLTYHGAPIWYLVVALLHLPCYGLFALVVRLKQSLLQRWFCNSYTYVK